MIKRLHSVAQCVCILLVFYYARLRRCIHLYRMQVLLHVYLVRRLLRLLREKYYMTLQDHKEAAESNDCHIRPADILSVIAYIKTEESEKSKPIDLTAGATVVVSTINIMNSNTPWSKEMIAAICSTMGLRPNDFQIEVHRFTHSADLLTETY